MELVDLSSYFLRDLKIRCHWPNTTIDFGGLPNENWRDDLASCGHTSRFYWCPLNSGVPKSLPTCKVGGGRDNWQVANVLRLIRLGWCFQLSYFLMHFSFSLHHWLQIRQKCSVLVKQSVHKTDAAGQALLSSSVQPFIFTQAQRDKERRAVTR